MDQKSLTPEQEATIQWMTAAIFLYPMLVWFGAYFLSWIAEGAFGWDWTTDDRVYKSLFAMSAVLWIWPLKLMKRAFVRSALEKAGTLET